MAGALLIAGRVAVAPPALTWTVVERHVFCVAPNLEQIGPAKGGE